MPLLSCSVAPLKRHLPASSPILPKPSGLRDLNHIPAVSDDIFAHNAPQIVKYLNRQMVSLVNNMLDLNKKLTESKIPQAIEVLKRQLGSTDKQIDHLVYNLYDLADKELKIVESET